MEGLELEEPLVKLNHALCNFKSANKHVKMHLQLPKPKTTTAKGEAKAKASSLQ